jgi:hypothetical protein
MPIRFRDSSTIVGRIRAGLDSTTASIAGTHTAPPARTGTIAASLAQVSSVMIGAFQNALRTGTIAGALDNIYASLVSPPASSTWWPNWPMMNANTLQGDVSQNLLDSSQHGVLADQSLFIIQDFYPSSSRAASRILNINQVRAVRGQAGYPKVLLYKGVQQTIKDQALVQQSGLEIQRDIIASPTEGNPNWYVHRVAPNTAQIVEPNFGQTQNRQCNMAALVSGLNSLGENYLQVFWRKWDVLLSNASNNLKAIIDGFFQDNFNARPPAMWINNGASQITDYDFNGDGTIDTRADFGTGANAGGRHWAQGHLESVARMKARFPNCVLIPNGGQLDADYFDGAGQPPLPMSNHPFNRKFEIIVRESISNSLGLQKSATAYSFTPGAVSTALRAYYMQETFLKLDSQNTLTGKGCVLLHATCVDRATATVDDYTYARFITGLCMLVERAGVSVQQSAAIPLSLDETLLEFGNPVAPRSMGTLNQNVPSFSMRAANFSSGVARFYWAIFAQALVLVRTDAPTAGVYPSADAAVACTLPSPGAGKKWQRINAATYVNPITGRAMRGQDLSVNNGADVTTVSLKPYHAIFLRLVNS